MNKIDKAYAEFRELDDLSVRNTPIHRLHPSVKLITTIAYIAVTVSFDKYDLSGLLLMIVYPILMYSLSDTSFVMCFRKMAPVLPLVLAVGLFNPFLDHTPVLRVGNVLLTGGMFSMVTLMLKGILCLMASFLLIATTRFDAVCASLRHMHVPGILVTLLLLTYRYIAVMMEEVSVMTDAYHLRAPKQKGIHISAWGSFLGQLLLRSMDKASELYAAMRLRGYDGDFAYAGLRKMNAGDILYLSGTVVCILLLRFVNIAEMIGGMVV